MKQNQYFQTLIAIHNEFFHDCNFGVRNGFKAEKEINDIIESIILKEHSSQKEFLTDLVKVAATIVLYQPFLDGNNRTALILIYLIAKEKGYYLDITRMWNHLLKGAYHIPTIYHKEDEISPTTLIKTAKYLKKGKINNSKKNNLKSFKNTD